MWTNLGNPALDPTLANFPMGTLENNLFNKENENNQVIYWRYVDDTFCIFRKDMMFINFFNRLNTLHKPITFTYELGGNELPFLVNTNKRLKLNIQKTCENS